MHQSPLHAHSLPRLVQTNAEFEHGCAVARKVLIDLGFDPKKLDEFSKKQKHAIVRNAMPRPHICAAAKNTVPPTYIKMIRKEMTECFKTTPCAEGNAPGQGVTLWEMLTEGLAFLSRIIYTYEQGRYTGLPQEAFVKQVYDVVRGDVIHAYVELRVGHYMQTLLNRLSQVNYRVYSFKYFMESLEATMDTRMRIEIIAHECESRYFTHNGQRRIAFKVMLKEHENWREIQEIGKDVRSLRRPLLRKDLFPNDPDGEREVDIYLQSHALHRYKERVNMLHPRDRNALLYLFLTSIPKVVHTPYGPLLVCRLLHGVVGYFAFFTDGSNVVVSTFLPIVNPITPEGRKLYRILRLTKAETSYLGMDKLDFFLQVDINKIPLLKQALVDANIYILVETLRDVVGRALEGQSPDVLLDEKRTQFVAQFFDKWQQNQAERTAYDDDIRAAEAEAIAAMGAEDFDAFALDAAYYAANNE